MVSFQEVEYTPKKHIFRKIYDRYKTGLGIGYEIFKSNVKTAENFLIYKDDKEIGFLSFVYKADSFMLYIHYFAVVEQINIKKDLYRLFLSRGYYLTVVCYYRSKKKRFYCYKIKH